jgi:hypothetical protein
VQRPFSSGRWRISCRPSTLKEAMLSSGELDTDHSVQIFGPGVVRGRRVRGGAAHGSSCGHRDDEDGRQRYPNRTKMRNVNFGRLARFGGTTALRAKWSSAPAALKYANATIRRSLAPERYFKRLAPLPAIGRPRAPGFPVVGRFRERRRHARTARRSARRSAACRDAVGRER